MASKKEQRQLRVLEKLQAEFAMEEEADQKRFRMHESDLHMRNFCFQHSTRWWYLNTQINNIIRNMKGI